MSYETVILEKKGERVAHITLNRPEKLNAINDVMMRDLKAALQEVEKDTETWVVVIKGMGESFSTGEDLSLKWPSDVMTPPPKERWFLSELWESEMRKSNFWQYIYDFPRFTIAQIHGHCLGWGCFLAMVCRTSIASEDAVFGDPSIRAGFTSLNPLWTWKVGVRKARELLFTGKYIDGREAARLGLITIAVPKEKLEEEVDLAVESLIIGTPIGGFDSESFDMIFGRTAFDISGLAAAWGYATNVHALSAIQRRGFEPGEFDFFEARERLGMKGAIEERDRPFKELGF
ncbi:MAG: enoyl-CoA hydratase/isomerase family protein [Thermodesulfobacteriota bacterium]|nr:enoyl-CoA hydratase/isomerase family protein [Thermodesulfobacteriota bacterium]